ncbi:MAG TPA: chitobiase/beta-hexosaminidase C-terminal domain-containing protein, partial [Methanobacterium sp.]|nr:chitobiase/beta-hexosaminidase C-terminal domain-containing protein [Methanobacterium sp.]
MNKYNKITLLTIFIVLLCVSLGSVSAAGTENTGPTVTANLTSGTYNTTQTAALTANDSSATIYYSNDTTDPRTSTTRIKYTEPLTIDKTTTLRYTAVDTLGNWSQVYIQNYVIGNSTINYTNGQSNYTGPQTNTTDWTYNIGGSNTDSSIAIGPDGTIYVGTINCATRDGYLYAFKPNGTLKWTYHTGGVTAITIGSNGIIYLKNYSGIEYAFNPNGTLKWNTNE